MINEPVWSNVGMTLIGKNRKYSNKTFQCPVCPLSHMWPGNESRPSW